MAGIRWPPVEGEHGLAARAEAGRFAEGESTAPYSDDDRSVAADSWSVKSEYGSTLDGDDQRQADAECMASSSFRGSDYSFDKDEQFKEEQDTETVQSVLGLQTYWESTYAGELSNFYEHGDTGEIWFGEDVMETVASWIAGVCTSMSTEFHADPGGGLSTLSLQDSDVPLEAQTREDLSGWNVLDIGTGNGLLLQALAKQGFVDLTGIDYSDAAIQLAKVVAERNGYVDIKLLVDDVLETKLKTQFRLVTDKGTFDAIGLHPEGPSRRNLYWKAVSKLVAPGGVLVITSCNSTKDELVGEACSYLQNSTSISSKSEEHASTSLTSSVSFDAQPVFQYIDHVRTYPVFCFGGVEGTRVSTVAFRHVTL